MAHVSSEAIIPTRAQRRVLGNILAGCPTFHGGIGRSNQKKTLTSLHRRGWLDENGRVSPAGEAALLAKVVVKNPYRSRRCSGLSPGTVGELKELLKLARQVSTKPTKSDNG